MKQKIIEFIKSKYKYILFIFLSIYFFSFAPMLFWDSGHYMTYVAIFEGNLPMSSWDVVRGPTFPILVYLANTLFGKSTTGLLILMYIFYLIMLHYVKKILDIAFQDIGNKILKNILYTIVLALIILNPYIFGYYHVLLTEFVATTLAVVGCYYSLLWIDVDVKDSKVKYIGYTLLFTILSIIAYFLKQPYVATILFPFLIASFISVVKQIKNWKNIIFRGLSVGFCLVVLLGSIKYWNKYLASQSVNTNTNRNVTNYVGNRFIAPGRNYEINLLNSETEDDVDIEHLSSKDKNKLDLDDNNYYLINIYDKNHNLIDYELFDIDSSEGLTAFESIFFLSKQMVKHPSLIFDAYFLNYMKLIDIYKPNEKNYFIERKVVKKYCDENCTIGLRPIKSIENLMYMPPFEKYVNQYYQFNKPPKVFQKTLNKGIEPFKLSFKILFLILPFTTLIFTILAIFLKYKSKKVYYLSLILLWYSFLHTMLYTISEHNIDRYLTSCRITSFLGILIFITSFVVNIYSNKKDKLENQLKKTNKKLEKKYHSNKKKK